MGSKPPSMPRSMPRALLVERAFGRRLGMNFLAAALLSALSLSAFAQTPEPSDANKEKARLLMDRGVEREEARDFSSALSAYEEAHALVGLPMTGLAVARVQVSRGHLVEALALAQTVKQMPKWAHETPAYDKARSSAASLEQQLLKRIPAIQVQVEGAGGDPYAIAIDGQPVDAKEAAQPKKVNPGKHVVRVSGADFETAEQEIESSEGEVLTIPIVLKRLSGGARKSQGWISSPMVWIGFGVGAAGVLAGTATGILSLNQTAEIKDKYCKQNQCDSSQRNTLQYANTLANVSNIAFAIGGAGVVVGVVGILISGGDKHNAAGPWVRPVAGLGSVGLIGVF